MSKNNLKSMSSVLEDLRSQGFTEDFRFEKNCLISMEHPDRRYSANEVDILDTYRFEGDTDPADASILYVIETNDGLKGTISNAYGPTADVNLDAFFNHQAIP